MFLRWNKGFYSILITAICSALHHSHAIAVSNDRPNGLLRTLHHSTPARGYAKSRGERYALASSQPVHRTRIAESFSAICASRLYVPDSKRTMQVSISDARRCQAVPRRGPSRVRSAWSALTSPGHCQLRPLRPRPLRPLTTRHPYYSYPYSPTHTSEAIFWPLVGVDDSILAPSSELS